MKYKYCLLSVGVFLLTTSFKSHDLAPSRILNLFYIDNSYSKTYENFSQDMFDLVDKKIESLKDDKFSPIGFFLANGGRTEFASNYKGSKNFINRLSNSNSDAPNSFYDRSFIVEQLLTTDLSNIRGVNINLFLTEAGMLNDYLAGANAGILINTLPKEMQYLFDCKEESINVTIYYPAPSKKVDLKKLELFTDLTKKHNDFASKIKFKFQPI